MSTRFNDGPAKAKRIALSPSAASAIETDIVDAYDPERAYEEEPWAERIRLAYRHEALHVLPIRADEMASALNEFSNHCDELSQEPRVSQEERKFYRRASDSLTTAVFNVRRIAR